ncbi:cell division [Sparganum proliferum]
MYTASTDKPMSIDFVQLSMDTRSVSGAIHDSRNMHSGAKAATRSISSKVPGHLSKSAAIKLPPKAVHQADNPFVRPASSSVPRATSSLFKSSSCQNIKGSRSTSQSSQDSRASSREKTRKDPAVPRHHHSSSTLSSMNTKLSSRNTPHNSTSSVLVKSNTSSATAPLPSMLRDTPRKDDRITVNSDLLSRVEKEKKQYESRISELTHLTEARKMEIERLTFQLRNLKQEKEEAQAAAKRAQAEAESLRSRLGDFAVGCDSSKLIQEESTAPCTLPPSGPDCVDQSSSNSSYPRNRSHSPPESLCTTTRMTLGGTTSVFHPDHATASLYSASNCSNRDNEMDCNDTIALEERSLCDTLASNSLTRAGSAPRTVTGLTATSVANLQGRIHEMEEANYTTTEELQATMEELCDLQRTLDESQDQNRTLAFERAILLESLCTQTAKLENCRFQIDQLKYLLMTHPDAMNANSRESSFVELYASLEEEKKVLLAQNNDLAQSSDSLAQECRVLTERANQLLTSLNTLEGEHEALQAAHSTLLTELNTFKSEKEGLKSPLRATMTTTGLEVAMDVALASEQKVLEARIEELTKSSKYWQDKFELAQAEHEREATEWRLYERDLLKTVRVADGIKAESEEEMARMAVENHDLREQVKKANDEVARLQAEIQRLQTQLAQTAVSQTAAASKPGTPAANVSRRSSVPVGPSNTTPSSSSAAAGSSTGSFFSSAFPHRSGRYLQQLGLQASPGGPNSLRTGPTVQNLIQSIENQLKAVQQQKMSQSRGASPPTLLCRQKSGLSAFSCQAAETPRVHSAGSSPNSTPLRSVGSADAADSGRSLSPEVRSRVHRQLLGLSEPSSDLPTVAATSSMMKSVESSAPAPGGPPPPASPQPVFRRASEFPSREGVTKLSCHVSPSPNHESRSRPLTQPLFRSLNGDTSRQENFRAAQLKFSTPSSPPIFPGRSFRSTDGQSTATGGDGGDDKSACDSPAPQPTAADTKSAYNGLTTLHPASTAPPASASSSASASSNGAGGRPQSPDLASAATTVVVVPDPVALPLRPDPLQELAKRTNAGSKRNALLRWCQSRIAGYRGVEVTNFSSSWNDGLALCALLHTYLPSKIAWDSLDDRQTLSDKQRRFEIAFAAAESEGIPTTLTLHDMLTKDRPDWNSVMNYIAAIYRHFEVH